MNTKKIIIIKTVNYITNKNVEWLTLLFVHRKN